HLPVPVRHLDVGLADAAPRQAHEHLAGPRGVELDRLPLQRPVVGAHDRGPRAHPAYPPTATRPIRSSSASSLSTRWSSACESIGLSFSPGNAARTSVWSPMIVLGAWQSRLCAYAIPSSTQTPSS